MADARLDEVDGTYVVMVDGVRLGIVRQLRDGWHVTDVVQTLRNSRGSRQPKPTPRRAFVSYFGTGRSFKAWVGPLAKTLPDDQAVPAPRPRVDLAKLRAQADEASSKAREAEADFNRALDALVELDVK